MLFEDFALSTSFWGRSKMRIFLRIKIAEKEFCCLQCKEAASSGKALHHSVVGGLAGELRTGENSLKKNLSNKVIKKFKKCFTLASLASQTIIQGVNGPSQRRKKPYFRP